ncbi:MAG: hypothetical protein JXL97_13840 [Bacteroidales bacterium]|nr:hypothetical protein [Bacteroidales bacterium]
MVNFTELLDKMTALVTDTTELFKYEKLVTGEESPEDAFEQVSSRKNGTAKLIKVDRFYYTPEKVFVTKYVYLMDIYLYTEDPNVNIDSFVSLFEGAVRQYLNLVYDQTKGKLYDFTNINIINAGTPENAEDIAREKRLYSNFFYVYSGNTVVFSSSSAFGGNSGFLCTEHPLENFPHEIGHLLGYTNTDIDPNNPDSDWSHNNNSKSIMFGRPQSTGKLLIEDCDKFNFQIKSLGFVGNPKANAIYNLNSFVDMPKLLIGKYDDEKPIPQPYYWDWEGNPMYDFQTYFQFCLYRFPKPLKYAI